MLMMPILIPVALSTVLGPGMGQLYNKDYRKAAILIVLSFGLLMAFSVWLGRAAFPYLPGDLSAVDRNTLRGIIQNHIVPEHGFTFYTYEMLLAGVWIYGIWDAWRVSLRRRADKIVSLKSS